MAEKEKEENYAKVIDFPKEVRVYGNISHVYFEGNDEHTTLVIKQDKPSTSDATPKRKKSTKEPVLIVPVKQSNSELRFVKVPLHKLSKNPKAEKLGYSTCPIVNPQGGRPTMEKITEYSTNLEDFPKKDTGGRIKNPFDSCFIFQQSDPLQKDFLRGSTLPIADLFRFQQQQKLEEPVIKPILHKSSPQVIKKPSIRETETNTERPERLLKYLITLNNRKPENSQ